VKHISAVEKCHKHYKRFIEMPHPILNSILIGTAIVLFWRGMWGVLDMYLFPNNDAVSYAISTLLGILVLVIHNGFKDIKELE